MRQLKIICSFASPLHAIPPQGVAQGWWRTTRWEINFSFKPKGAEEFLPLRRGFFHLYLGLTFRTFVVQGLLLLAISEPPPNRGWRAVWSLESCDSIICPSTGLRDQWLTCSLVCATTTGVCVYVCVLLRFGCRVAGPCNKLNNANEIVPMCFGVVLWPVVYYCSPGEGNCGVWLFLWAYGRVQRKSARIYLKKTIMCGHRTVTFRLSALVISHYTKRVRFIMIWWPRFILIRLIMVSILDIHMEAEH